MIINQIIIADDAWKIQLILMTIIVLLFQSMILIFRMVHTICRLLPSINLLLYYCCCSSSTYVLEVARKTPGAFGSTPLCTLYSEISFVHEKRERTYKNREAKHGREGRPGSIGSPSKSAEMPVCGADQVSGSLPCPPIG